MDSEENVRTMIKEIETLNPAQLQKTATVLLVGILDSVKKIQEHLEGSRVDPADDGRNF